MRLEIDGQQRDWKLDEDQTLGDFIIEMNKKLLVDEGRVITGIKIGDKGLDEKTKMLTPDQVMLDQIESISFDTQSFQDNLSEQYDIAEQTLQSVRESITDIISFMLSDQIDLAMNKLKEDVESLLAYVYKPLTNTERMGVIKTVDIPCGEGTLHDFLVRFKSTLQELLQAMENSDTTLINDFLEYEVEPSLGEFKTVIKPIKEKIAAFDFSSLYGN